MYQSHFASLGDHIWLNTAHQGALPNRAQAELSEALEWKRHPYHMTTEKFSGLPRRIRELIGRLIDVPADDVIVANSSSYGLHLLANGIRWNRKDEVVLVKGDFPSTILPWLGLEKLGVRIKYVEPKDSVLNLKDLAGAVTTKTRLFCTNWVHSFTGTRLDEQKIGDFCRKQGIIFVLNCSQGIGAIPLSLSTSPVDAITSVGFKWLCGPYGTGFCWVRPDLLSELDYNKNYWLAMQTADDLEEDRPLDLNKNLGARRYDIFGTANFFNFKPWAGSLDLVLEIGVETIARHDRMLVNYFIERLDTDRYELISPTDPERQSALVLFRPVESDQTRPIYDRLKKKRIHLAVRRGHLRMSPHLYNTTDDVDHLLDQL